MRLNWIDFAGEPALPHNITVSMTVTEAAAIARVFGALNDYGLRRLGLDDSGIYDCLTGDVFNRYWDDGVNDVLTRIALAGINNPPEAP